MSAGAPLPELGGGAPGPGLIEPHAQPSPRPALASPLTEAEVQALGAGFAVIRDGLLGAELTRDVRSEVVALWRDGLLTPAAIGRGPGRARRPDVRGDVTCWLEPTPERPALARLHAFFTALGDEVNEAAWLGLRAFDVQVALYPGGGARYLRHRDTFRGRAERRLTAIWYANPGWCPSDGGALRVHEPGASRSIAPVADRLVLFRSDVLEHAVAPSRSQRVALTAWYRGAP
ncbi:MAG: 2OG-Fe(II) oxygenase [Deltaproteobacteria bacterium]|nr:2OG-Fe(II) oxygenase [Deltaproteobacteria bacterium]